MKSISIVTPWWNCSELIRVYESSVKGAQAIVIDNGSDLMHSELIEMMISRLGNDSKYIRNETNVGFSTANNQGLAEASGDIVVFMNNDVECRAGFFDRIRSEIEENTICGASLLFKHGIPYLEGFCVFAYRDIWNKLGGWDDQYYSGLYWEDNDLCFRAVYHGYKLKRVNLPIWHFNNYTTRIVSGAMDQSAENERKFLERVRKWEAERDSNYGV